ncbi:MAG: O-antigen ligase family protein [Acidobacteriia bacterium]|nr:O-antigen ligase family protein [Terriglobia bacterium]
MEKTAVPPAEGTVPGSRVRRAFQSHWGAGFAGVIIYEVVEYARLPAMYPILGPLQLGKIGIIIALVGLLYSPPETKTLVQSSWRRIAEVSLLAFFGAGVLSGLFAPDTEAAVACILLIINWLVIYFAVSRSVSTPWRLRAFIFVYLLFSLKMGQFVVRSYHGAMANSPRSQMSLMTEGFGAGATGFFGNAADLGVAMCVAWPIAMSLLFSDVKGWKRFALLVCTLVFLGAIMFCGSRGAIVGATGVTIAAWLRSPKKLIAVFLLLLLVPAVIFVMPEATKRRMNSGLLDPERDRTASQRLELWRAGVQMYKENPILGVGPLNFGAVYGARFNRGERLSERVSWVPHSTYIEAISEWGTFGCIFLVLIALAIFRINAMTRKSILAAQGKAGKSSFEFCLATGLELGFIGYLVSGAFVAVLLYPHIFILLSLSAGLNSSVLSRKGAPAPGPEPPKRRFAPALGVAG